MPITCYEPTLRDLDFEENVPLKPVAKRVKLEQTRSSPFSPGSHNRLPMSEPEDVIIDERTLRSFIVAKCAANSFSVSSIDYDASGSHLVAACVGSLSVYDLADGERQKKVMSQKYGTDIVRWTHHPDTVVYSGPNVNPGTLRYLSLYDNQHIGYFEGHTDPICSIDVSPASDEVLTGSVDGSVRLWDLASPTCAAILQMSDEAKLRPLVAFDPSGVMFVVAVAPWVRCYSMRQLGGGPFAEFNLEASLREVSAHRCNGRFKPTFTSCKIDMDGKWIVLGTNQGLTLVVDAFKGRLESVLGDFEISMTTPTEASFSPDGRYVLRGGTDGSIRCWNRKTAALVKTWEHAHSAPVRCLKFNPTSLNFTSTCNNINMWIPNPTHPSRKSSSHSSPNTTPTAHSSLQ